MTRLWRYPGTRATKPASLRYLYHAQGARCAYCQRLTILPPNGSDTRSPGLLYASRDHRHPQSRGGDNHRPNLAMACMPCNQIKGDMLWLEWKEFMCENPQWWERPAAINVPVEAPDHEPKNRIPRPSMTAAETVEWLKSKAEGVAS